MSAKTKIVVVKMKEIFLTGTFVICGIILLLILFFIFSPSKSTVEDTKSSKYIPGIYHSCINLSGMEVDLEVTLDSNHINAIHLVNLEDTITTMYPLLSPTFLSLSNQICQKQSIEQITYEPENKYTSLILLKSIEQTLQKATLDSTNK